jgi:hypothetical protein
MSASQNTKFHHTKFFHLCRHLGAAAEAPQLTELAGLNLEKVNVCYLACIS